MELTMSRENRITSLINEISVKLKVQVFDKFIQCFIRLVDNETLKP